MVEQIINQFVIPIGIFFLVVAAFLTWRDEHRKNLSQKPRLKFEHLGFALNDFGEKGSGIVLQLSFDNLGDKVFIPDKNWCITAKHKGNKFKSTRTIISPLGELINVINRKGKRIEQVRFVSQDSLCNKLANSLERPPSDIGFLLINFPTMPYKILNEDTTIIDVKCWDAYHNVFTFRKSIGKMSENYGIKRFQGLISEHYQC